MSPPVLLALGGVYAVVFWIVALSSSRWALMLIFALTPFQNDVSGGGPLKFSIAEINLLLAVPVMLIKSRRLRFGPTLIPACLYIGVCFFSALGQWRPSALQSIIQVGIFTIMLVVVFASLARQPEDYRLAFDGLIVVCVFLGCSIFATGSSYIYGLHKNGVGASLAGTFVIALELWLGSTARSRRLFYLGSAAVMALGCLVTVSRGAWMTAIVGSLAVIGVRGRIRLAFKCLLVIAPLLAVGWHFLPDNSREYATGFGQEHLNIKARYDSIDYALKLFAANPIQGAGMGLRKDYDATNIILLCLAETGVPGLVTFLALNGTVVVLVLGAFRRVPKQTISSSILGISLGLILGKLVHGLVDHYWSRGSLSAAWATVGMLTFVLYDHRRQRQQLARARAVEAYQQASADLPPAAALSLAQPRGGG